MDTQQLDTARSKPAAALPRAVFGDPTIDDRLSPPRRGLPLGTVLGATISVLLALLLGGLTAVQLRRDERAAQAARERLLAESLVPLASELERAVSLSEVEELMSFGERAEIARGHPDFGLLLIDDDGRVLDSKGAAAVASPPPGSIQAQVPVRSILFGSGQATLAAWQDSAEFRAEMASRRNETWLDIGAAVLMVIVVVQLTVYLLVTRPLRCLLATIEKFEQGYPARLRQVDIARELRWLEWRFHRMSASVTTSARLLVAAHQRAMEASKSRPKTGIDPRLFDPLDLDHGGDSASYEVMLRYLTSRCALLEGLRPGDPRAREVALEVWDRDAVEAERFGAMRLRVRLENTSLMILDPGAFDRVSRGLDALMAARSEWTTATIDTIRNALANDRVPVLALQHRVKHVAGVWRKMRERQLDLEDVADLVAFRIIVPGYDDCYLALGTIHRLFEPEPFRFKDYIANPKANGYRSLHTSVRDHVGFVFEVQIRTAEMHRGAEEGGAAHWKYRARKALRS